MALYCIISEIKRDIGLNHIFLIHHLHATPPLRVPHQNIAITFGIKKLPIGVASGYQMVEKV